MCIAYLLEDSYLEFFVLSFLSWLVLRRCSLSFPTRDTTAVTTTTLFITSLYYATMFSGFTSARTKQALREHFSHYTTILFAYQIVFLREPHFLSELSLSRFWSEWKFSHVSIPMFTAIDSFLFSCCHGNAPSHIGAFG